MTVVGSSNVDRGAAVVSSNNDKACVKVLHDVRTMVKLVGANMHIVVKRLRRILLLILVYVLVALAPCRFTREAQMNLRVATQTA